jgi:amino acid transporter
MFGVIVFAGVAFVVAFVMTMLYLMTRRFEFRDEARPGRVFVIWFIIAVVGPYLFVETLTRSVGPTMSDAVKAGYDDADFRGPLLYYKVLFYTGTKAKVVAIGEEKQDWGGMDHPTVTMDLLFDDGKWKMDSYHVAISDRMNRDGIIYPPYW